MYVTKKDMCFVRKLDDIGRITIPRDVRNIYNLSPGDSVEILCGENDMRIRKHELRDCFFASSEKIIEGCKRFFSQILNDWEGLCTDYSTKRLADVAYFWIE